MPVDRVTTKDEERSRALRRRWVGIILLAAAIALVLALPGCQRPGGTSGAADPADSARPALTVTLATLRGELWPVEQTANGSVEAWQEVMVGSEVTGLRLVEVGADVGDRVRAGQVLARLDDETVRADLAQARAALVEAEATRVEAQANARRAATLGKGGALSAQQLEQFRTAGQTATARVEVQRARVQAVELRLARTRIVAPFDGIVSARLAATGAIAQAGGELFRLIRNGRLEWRAELPAPQLARVAPGQRVWLTMVGGGQIEGRVRVVAPTIDQRTRMGLVYVDLPPASAARAGSFARGRIVLGERAADTLPQTALTLRDGFDTVFRVDENARAVQTRVTIGRRVGDRVEILGGLAPDGRVVEVGASFLADGDRVRIVSAASIDRPAPRAQRADPAGPAAADQTD